MSSGCISVPPVACGRILANYKSDLISSLHRQILREYFQIEVVAAKIVSEISLANNVDLAVISFKVLARRGELSFHHPGTLVCKSDDLVKILPRFCLW